MSIFLPVAGVSLSLLYVLGIGASVGVLSGLVGVGGGFLLTPALMMIGVPPVVAAASGSCQMVATSSSGVAAHFRLGNVDIKMGTLLLTGGWLGAAVGVRFIKALRGAGEADLLITLTYILVLGSLGAYMLLQSLRSIRRGPMVRRQAKLYRRQGVLAELPWQVDFPRSGVRHSVLFPPTLAFLVGLLASIMGVGGGFIMLPMMVYLLGMPTHVAVGTDLFQILFLCIGVTYMQATTNQTVDLVLALTMATGSAVGAQVGARLSRLLRGEQLMIVLASLVVGVTLKMVFGLVLTPSSQLHPAEVAISPPLSRPIAPQSPGARPNLLAPSGKVGP